MFTVLDFMEAYGTSEGSTRGWDSRGRSRKDPRKMGDVGEYWDQHTPKTTPQKPKKTSPMRAYGTSEGVKKEWESRARTGAVLQGHGWRQSTPHRFTHPIHKDHAIIVRGDDSWNHEQTMSKGGPVERGRGQNGAELNKHLLNYNWGGRQGRHSDHD